MTDDNEPNARTPPATRRPYKPRKVKPRSLGYKATSVCFTETQLALIQSDAALQQVSLSEFMRGVVAFYYDHKDKVRLR